MHDSQSLVIAGTPRLSCVRLRDPLLFTRASSRDRAVRRAGREVILGIRGSPAR